MGGAPERLDDHLRPPALADVDFEVGGLADDDVVRPDTPQGRPERLALDQLLADRAGDDHLAGQPEPAGRGPGQDHRRGGALHVGSAPAVEPAADNLPTVRVVRPAAALAGRDGVDVRVQQRGRAAVAGRAEDAAVLVNCHAPVAEATHLLRDDAGDRALLPARARLAHQPLGQRRDLVLELRERLVLLHPVAHARLPRRSRALSSTPNRCASPAHGRVKLAV